MSAITFELIGVLDDQGRRRVSLTLGTGQRGVMRNVGIQGLFDPDQADTVAAEMTRLAAWARQPAGGA